jgi:dihydroxyacetone kinase-like protein
MDFFSNEKGAKIVLDLIDTIQQNKAYLSEIDGAIGDGDHGINMNKGFTICGEYLEGKNANLTESLEVLGNVLLTEIGGSMGPIYGSFFLEMSETLGSHTNIDKELFGEMMKSGLEGIRALVPTDVGDKTLLDTLIPAVEAYGRALNAQMTFKEALNAMQEAAEAGKESTRDMVAKVGRASRLGERSRGVLDAGATSCNLIVHSMCNTVDFLIS